MRQGGGSVAEEVRGKRRCDNCDALLDVMNDEEDAAARAEAERLFPGEDIDGVLCGDCYEKFLEWYGKQGGAA